MAKTRSSAKTPSRSSARLAAKRLWLGKASAKGSVKKQSSSCRTASNTTTTTTTTNKPTSPSVSSNGPRLKITYKAYDVLKANPPPSKTGLKLKITYKAYDRLEAKGFKALREYRKAQRLARKRSETEAGAEALLTAAAEAFGTPIFKLKSESESSAL